MDELDADATGTFVALDAVGAAFDWLRNRSHPAEAIALSTIATSISAEGRTETDTASTITEERDICKRIARVTHDYDIAILVAFTRAM